MFEHTENMTGWGRLIALHKKHVAEYGPGLISKRAGKAVPIYWVKKY